MEELLCRASPDSQSLTRRVVRRRCRAQTMKPTPMEMATITVQVSSELLGETDAQPFDES